MKTRKLTLCAFAAIAALATACSNDEPASTDTPHEGIVIEATASTPQGGADTRLTHKDEGANMDIVWAAGDNFTAYSAGTTASYDIIPKEAGSGFASFTGTWGTTPSGDVYAIYPSNPANDPAAITLSLEGQTGSLDDLKSCNYMTATATYESGKSLNFGFTHQVAIVKLALTFPDGVTGDAGNIGLKATGLNKSVDLNLITGYPSNEVAGDVITSRDFTITNKQITAYLCLFPGSLTNVKVIAKVGTDDYEVDLSDLGIAAGSMYTAAVTMKKKAADFIEVNGIKVAVGNLVADGEHGAKIGAPTDGGLYFQFGSLIGWAGGTTGDGTGVPGSDTPGYDFNATGTVVPSGKTIPTTWGDPDKWTGNKGDAPVQYDPCTQYLGSDWRLPTNDEYAVLFNNVTDGDYTNSGGWTWDATAKSATNNTKNLTFPASGYRSYTDGGLNNVGTYGYSWSASAQTSSNGYSLRFDSSSVTPSGKGYRVRGLPVRCVRASN